MVIKIANKEEKKRFLKELYKKASANRHPYSIMFELTYSCNFRCVHCYLPGGEQNRQELDTEQVFSVLDQLKDLGVYHIGFTGGEALVREDIYEILNYAAHCGFNFGLLTNGYLIDAQAAEKLKRVCVDHVALTFNALTSRLFDQITQVDGSFSKVKRAVEILKRKRVEVQLKSTCMSINKNEILSINRYARKKEILHFIDGEITPSRNNDTSWVDEYAVSGEEYEGLRRSVYPEMFSGNRPSSRSKKRRNRIFNCGVGQTSFSINPYGQMNFCLEIDYPRYNILSLGAKACWDKIKQEVDQLNKRRDFVCRDCDLFHSCGWCPGRSFIEGKGFNACSDFFKNRALARQQIKRRKRKNG